MSIKSKNNVKIIFKTILHILIFSIVSFIIFNLSFINTKKVGISTGILFSKEIYEINIIIFIICIASFILDLFGKVIEQNSQNMISLIQEYKSGDDNDIYINSTYRCNSRYAYNYNF